VVFLVLLLFPTLAASFLPLAATLSLGLLALHETAAVLKLIALLGALAQLCPLFGGQLIQTALAAVGALDRAAPVAPQVLDCLACFGAFSFAELAVAVLVEALQGAVEGLALFDMLAPLLVGAVIATRAEVSIV
jgi:hypothetical protein